MSLLSKVRVVRQCLGVRSIQDGASIRTESTSAFHASSTPHNNFTESKVSEMNLSDISGQDSGSIALDEESLLRYQMLTINPILRHEIELTQQNAKFRNILYALIVLSIFLTVFIVFARVSYVYSARHEQIKN